MIAQSKALGDEIKESDFYKTSMQKEKERSEKKAKLRDETTTGSPRTPPESAESLNRRRSYLAAEPLPDSHPPVAAAPHCGRRPTPPRVIRPVPPRYAPLP